MATSAVRLLLIAALALGCQPKAVDGPEAVPQPRGLDRLGAPLPEGAVARFGTVQFRHAALRGYAYLPDTQQVVTVGMDRTVRTWDFASGRQLRAVQLADDPAQGVWFSLSPDGKTVASVFAQDGRVSLFEASTGRRLETFGGSGDQVMSATFSPDGSALACCTFSGTSTLRQVITGRSWSLPVSTLPGQRDRDLYRVRFSADGKRIAAGGGERTTLSVFDVATHEQVFRLEEPTSGAALSPDGTLLATQGKKLDGSRPATLVFEVATGKRLMELDTPRGLVPTAFSPDGRQLACGGDNGGCVVDLASKRVTHGLSGRTYWLRYTPDGRALIGAGTSRLRVWDAATGRERTPEGEEDASGIALMAASPDGRLVASVRRWERTVSVWDVATGQLVLGKRIEGPDGAGGTWGTHSVGFSADGRVVRVGLTGGEIRSWELTNQTERPTAKLPITNPWVYLVFGDDSRRAFTMETGRDRERGDTRKLTTWDLESGKPVADLFLPWRSEQVFGDWTQGGPTIAAKVGNEVWAYDTRTNQPRVLKGAALPHPNDAHNFHAVSPDGRLAAAPIVGDPPVASQIGVWEAATGRRVLTIDGGKPVFQAFAPAARALVSAGHEGLVAYDLASGKVRFRRPFPSVPMNALLPVYGLICTPDGRHAVTILADGTALVWDLAATARERLAEKAGAAELAAWWADLAGEDAEKAYQAGWKLADAPASVVLPYLGERFKLLRPDAAAVPRLLRELDDDAFAAREAASRELRRMGKPIEPLLRAELARTTSPEVKQRLERLVAQLTADALGPETLRGPRAVAVLERIGTAEARKLLTELTETYWKADAQAALDRMLPAK